MRQLGYSCVLLAIVLSVQPWVREGLVTVGVPAPLAALLDISPLLVLMWGWRLEHGVLGFHVVVCGLLRDGFVTDVMGFTPLIWGLLVLLVATQRTWLNSFQLFYAVPLAFVISVIGFFLQRLAYTLLHGGEVCSYELAMLMLAAALVNAVLLPLLLIPLSGLYPRQVLNPPPGPVLRHVPA